MTLSDKTKELLSATKRQPRWKLITGIFFNKIKNLPLEPPATWYMWVQELRRPLKSLFANEKSWVTLAQESWGHGAMMTLGMSFNFFMPQFLHLYNGENDSAVPLRGLWKRMLHPVETPQGIQEGRIQPRERQFASDHHIGSIPAGECSDAPVTTNNPLASDRSSWDRSSYSDEESHKEYGLCWGRNTFVLLLLCEFFLWKIKLRPEGRVWTDCRGGIS